MLAMLRACAAVRNTNQNNPKENMVGLIGLEPMTPALSRRCSNQLSYRPRWQVNAEILKCLNAEIFQLFSFSPFQLLPAGGGYRIRTDDILLAKQTLYQLS